MLIIFLIGGLVGFLSNLGTDNEVEPEPYQGYRRLVLVSVFNSHICVRFGTSVPMPYLRPAYSNKRFHFVIIMILD